MSRPKSSEEFGKSIHLSFPSANQQEERRTSPGQISLSEFPELQERRTLDECDQTYGFRVDFFN